MDIPGLLPRLETDLPQQQSPAGRPRNKAIAVSEVTEQLAWWKVGKSMKSSENPLKSPGTKKTKQFKNVATALEFAK